MTKSIVRFSSKKTRMIILKMREGKMRAKNRDLLGSDHDDDKELAYHIF